jgi:ABC-type phosphate transport system permease subunit
MFCPYCEEPLVGERRGRSSGVDRDVKRDGAGTKVALGLLGVLGGIGTIWYFAAATSDSSGGMFVVGLLGLLLAGLLSTGIMFYRTSHNPSERGVGRVILGTFSLIGICLAAGCSLMVAVGVFLFVVCLAGGGRW